MSTPTGAPTSAPRGARPAGLGVTAVDHVGLAQPFDHFDEATLFYRAVLGLAARQRRRVRGPVRPRAQPCPADPDRRVRLALTVSLLRRGEWAPGIPEPQYIALAVDDVVAAARAARAAGAPLLGIPDNYYDDLAARVDLPPDRLAAYRELGVLHDQGPAGAYLQVCTEVLAGRIFVALVQRVGDDDGYGWTDTPVRMSAHRRQRLARRALTPG